VLVIATVRVAVAAGVGRPHRWALRLPTASNTRSTHLRAGPLVPAGNAPVSLGESPPFRGREPVDVTQLCNKHSLARWPVGPLARWPAGGSLADTAGGAQVRSGTGKRAWLHAAAVLEAAERLEGVLRSDGAGYVIVRR